MISMALFNNKGGVGKTMLAYHLAHMLARSGHRVLAVDLDPQANLTSYFLTEEDIEKLWADDEDSLDRPRAATVAKSVEPILHGVGDVKQITPLKVSPSAESISHAEQEEAKQIAPLELADNLWLAPGDLALSGFEDNLSEAWSNTVLGKPGPVRTTTAFYRVMRQAAREVAADVMLIDVGPNLGAINRSALLAADTVLVPLAADLFSLQGLRNLGPTFREWRAVWQDTVIPQVRKLPGNIEYPSGDMTPLGYVIMQPSVRLDRPVRAYQRWLDRIPTVYERHVLDGAGRDDLRPYQIATIRNYRSLMPLAHDARKPMFDLRPADGAIGSTQSYVQTCRTEFRQLAADIADRLDRLGGLDRPGETAPQ